MVIIWRVFLTERDIEKLAWRRTGTSGQISLGTHTYRAVGTRSGIPP